MLDGIAGDAATGPGPAESKRRLTFQLVTLAAAAAAIVLWGWQATTRPGNVSVAPGPVQFTLEPPEGGGFAYHAETNFLSISPDGRQIAYTAYDARGPRLWIRELNSPSPRPLRGTEGAAGHAWSPEAARSRSSRAVGCSGWTCPMARQSQSRKPAAVPAAT